MRRLVQPQRPLIGRLDREARRPVGFVHLFDDGCGAHERVGPDGGALLGETRHDGVEVGHRRQTLHAQRDLEHHLGKVVGGLADRPRPIGALAPRGPVQRQIGPDPGRFLLAGERVRRLPRHVAQEDVDLEALLDRLSLQERVFERGASLGDEVDEDVVEHAGREATVGDVTPADANPWLGRRVLTYAHQCGAWEAPSSTLFALRRALELGVTGIELDVHATRIVIWWSVTTARSNGPRTAMVPSTP